MTTSTMLNDETDENDPEFCSFLKECETEYETKLREKMNEIYSIGVDSLSSSIEYDVACCAATTEALMTKHKLETAEIELEKLRAELSSKEERIVELQTALKNKDENISRMKLEGDLLEAEKRVILEMKTTSGKIDNLVSRMKVLKKPHIKYSRRCNTLYDKSNDDAFAALISKQNPIESKQHINCLENFIKRCKESTSRPARRQRNGYDFLDNRKYARNYLKYRVMKDTDGCDYTFTASSDVSSLGSEGDSFTVMKSNHRQDCQDVQQ